MILTSFFRWSYARLLKPVLFLMDPEFIHNRFIGVGAFLGSNPVGRWKTAILFRYRNPALEQTVAGIRFPNPVGLSGGFDKDGHAVKIMPSVGFGFMEVGSVTARPCAGNPGKHLWRLPKSRGIVVYYGLKNRGAEAVAKRLRGKKFPIPLGINIARTNDDIASATDDAGIADYVMSLRVCRDIGDYVTINVSCPNSCGGETFTEPTRLDRLLGAIDAVGVAKPIFLKLGADLAFEEVDRIIAVADRHRIAGFILTNLTKSYTLPEIVQSELTEKMKGGISGKPVEALTNALISHVYERTGGTYAIIGCGGIFSAEDAYEKIRRGASLVQLITGMIFEGPQLIGDINRGLTALLKRDGFASIADAVGSRADK
jgi:dihydroorotate dehydrogenase